MRTHQHTQLQSALRNHLATQQISHFVTLNTNMDMSTATAQTKLQHYFNDIKARIFRHSRQRNEWAAWAKENAMAMTAAVKGLNAMHGYNTPIKHDVATEVTQTIESLSREELAGLLTERGINPTVITLIPKHVKFEDNT